MSAPATGAASPSGAPATAALSPRQLASLLELGRRARAAATPAELRFILVNDTHALAPLRQAALWLESGGVAAVSGVVQIEANAPFTQWLGRFARHLAAAAREPGVVEAAELPAELATEWAEWLAPHVLWLPLPAAPGARSEGGLVLGRDLPWAPADIVLLRDWLATWHHAWRLRHAAAPARWCGWLQPASGRRRWPWAIAAVVVAAGFLPVRLTVLAPGELVPHNPAVIRAPLEGVVATVHVQPNERVRAGQPLVGLDDVALRSRLDLAQQALLTAEAELRQVTQQALMDSRYKPQLSALAGRVEERRVERDLLADQLARTQVLSPRDGVALLDDPGEWIGRPVAVGERILRVADETDTEIEAWIPLADAVPLGAEARVSLFLDSDPLHPVRGRVRFLAHDSVARPDGTYAYRLRATLDGPSGQRVGLKGTARIDGERVSAAYWILRRPLARIRTYLGR